MPLPAVLARADDAPFVGRALPLERLRDRWRGAARGAGKLAVVAGEAGIGKSRLAARFATAVHEEGGAVLYGRADEESVTPYQPFVEALRHYAAHSHGLTDAAGLPAAAAEALGRLVPELGVSPAPVRARRRAEWERDRHELFEAVVGLLLHAARPNGLLLVLEDLHWADAPTSLLLRQVLRRGVRSPVLVLVTYRAPDPQATGIRLLADLRREADVDTIELGGLQPADVAALIAGRAPENGLSAERLCNQTGGNPFFIGELLRSSRDTGAPAVRVPEAVKDVIGGRLDELPRGTLETLTLAAVLGNDFRLATLELVAPDRDQDEVLAAVEAAVAAGLVYEDPQEVDRFSFTHALVRETLYERPIASRRLRLHRRVAQALEAAPLPVHPADLAHHYFQAREVGCAAKAVVYGLRAGQAAQDARAYEDASEHYERALVALNIIRRDDAAAHCDVLLAIGAARWQASEHDPRAPFERAVELARGLDSPERLAVAALGAGGRFYAPVATDSAYAGLLQEVLAVLEPGDSTLRVRVLARMAETLVFEQPVERAGELAGDAVAMARRLGEPGALAAALMGNHAALLHVEHVNERRRIGDETLALAGELGNLELGALARHWLLYDLAELGELDEARRRHGELELLADELQQPLYRHSALAWRGVWSGLAGRFEEAEQLADEAFRLAEQAGDADARMHYTAQLVALRREQGRLGELLGEIERIGAGDTPALAAWRSTLPLAYLDAGDRTRALAAYERAIAGGLATRPRTMLWLTETGALAEAAALLGDVDGGERLYAQLAPFADRLVQWTFAGSAGSVHRLLARTAAVAGMREAAQAHFEAALERHAELGAASLLARTRCDYGEFLLQGPRADRSRALRLLRDAGVAARGLGMTGITARVGRHGS